MSATLGVAAVTVLLVAVGIGIVQLPPSMNNVGPAPAASPIQTGEPSLEPVASPVAATIHGWPGARRAPAGLYSWEVRPANVSSRSNWMHKIPTGREGVCCTEVDLTFYASAAFSDVHDTVTDGVDRGWGVDGPFDRPAQTGSTEVWLLDVEGTRVAVVLDSYAHTDPALVDEARAVIESIVVEPTETGHRLVFRLQEGWDSG
jgi:hypothetical protein